MKRQIDNCPMKTECPCKEYSEEGLCDYPHLKKRHAVTWKFKCFDCGYTFRAIETKELFNSYTQCAICGSKNIEKKVTKP